MSPRTNLHVAGRESDSRRPRQSREPSTTNSSSSRARKIRAPRDSTPLGGVRKMAQNAPEKHPFRLKIVIELSMTDSEAPPLLNARTGMSTTLSVNATAALSGPWATVVHNSGNKLVQGLHCGIYLPWHNWNVQHSVEGTETRRRTRTTWTAGTRAA